MIWSRREKRRNAPNQSGSPQRRNALDATSGSWRTNTNAIKNDLRDLLVQQQSSILLLRDFAILDIITSVPAQAASTEEIYTQAAATR
ncbi:hypothetical protein LshimejAT787_0203390 [Lyophyllum shimeji]|uniref:Uncharacterized protein n=1 Tax=Lyophyllum shimeji TaxID=47721 RepID=A0A9P3PFX1_LYOSH|nr:hypothetical protein LshimejAT787_0203390 [Lyophyllum shimeji]